MNHRTESLTPSPRDRTRSPGRIAESFSHRDSTFSARFNTLLLRVAFCLIWVVVLRGASSLRASEFHNGIVATVHPIATQAGVDALKQGGNAIDAAVAAALMLGVVDGQNSGLGGGCFVVVRLANGRVIAVDGRETAPAAATRDMYRRNGRAVPALSQHGALAVGVPGQLAALSFVSAKFGRLPISQALERAARVAADGFVITRSYEGRLQGALQEIETLAPEPFLEFRRLFLKPDGSRWARGETFRQPDLAQTYRSLAEQGLGQFYQGDLSQRISDWMQNNGGLLTAADFAAYQPKVREPIRTTYRGYEIVGFPPPSSGGVHVGQILNILEHFDLRTLGNGSADTLHVVAEAMKLAFADRAHWLGDPDFTRVPRGLTDRKYAATLARQIRLDRTLLVTNYHTPPQSIRDVFPRVMESASTAPDSKHTTHFSTADAQGNWVAITATINTTFGSKVVVPGTGMVLNNEMDDFSAEPGAPNAFGLVGAEANAVGPGKRPLSSMSPTLVLKDGEPILSLGAAGGPTIISQTLLAIIQVIDFGADPITALAQPRFHQQWRPDELVLERSVPEAIREELVRRGHRLKRVEALGATQAVGQRGRGAAAVFIGAHDPRVEGLADGW